MKDYLFLDAMPDNLGGVIKRILLSFIILFIFKQKYSQVNSIVCLPME